MNRSVNNLNPLTKFPYKHYTATNAHIHPTHMDTHTHTHTHAHIQTHNHTEIQQRHKCTCIYIYIHADDKIHYFSYQRNGSTTSIRPAMKWGTGISSPPSPLPLYLLLMLPLLLPIFLLHPHLPSSASFTSSSPSSYLPSHCIHPSPSSSSPLLLPPPPPSPIVFYLLLPLLYLLLPSSTSFTSSSSSSPPPPPLLLLPSSSSSPLPPLFHLLFLLSSLSSLSSYSPSLRLNHHVDGATEPGKRERRKKFKLTLSCACTMCDKKYNALYTHQSNIHE